MSSSRSEYANPLRKKPLLLGAIAFSLCCFALPVVAQEPEPQNAFPNAPSANTPAVTATVGTPISNEHYLTFGERAHVYARNIFTFETIVGPAFGAGIGQWEDEPPAWRGGAEGYGKRFGSGAARRSISETIRFGVAAIDGEDPRYFHAENRGIWARTKHAVASSFVSQTSHGVTIPAFSRFLGVYGAAFIADAWYPDNRVSARDAVTRGTTSFAGGIGFHLLREFLPFHKDNK